MVGERVLDVTKIVAVGVKAAFGGEPGDGKIEIEVPEDVAIERPAPLEVILGEDVVAEVLFSRGAVPAD